jgi:hypothetical protein
LAAPALCTRARQRHRCLGKCRRPHVHVLLCVQVFNQETFMLSHGSYNGSKVGVRVMDYMQWVNSKVFFFSQRSAFFPGRPTPAAQLPVMVHMNYQ